MIDGLKSKKHEQMEGNNVLFLPVTATHACMERWKKDEKEDEKNRNQDITKQCAT